MHKGLSEMYRRDKFLKQTDVSFEEKTFTILSNHQESLLRIGVVGIARLIRSDQTNLQNFLYKYVPLQKESCIIICNLSALFRKVRNSQSSLILKAPITTAADDIYKYFFIGFQRK